MFVITQISDKSFSVSLQLAQGFHMTKRTWSGRDSKEEEDLKEDVSEEEDEEDHFGESVERFVGSVEKLEGLIEALKSNLPTVCTNKKLTQQETQPLATELLLKGQTSMNELETKSGSKRYNTMSSSKHALQAIQTSSTPFTG